MSIVRLLCLCIDDASKIFKNTEQFVLATEGRHIYFLERSWNGGRARCWLQRILAIVSSLRLFVLTSGGVGS